jgi:hypothetical protein
VPLIVGNLGPATFGRTTTRCCWWTRRRSRELPSADKDDAGAPTGAPRSPSASPRDSDPHDRDRLKVLDPRLADHLPPTPRPAAPAWTCAPAWTRRWCWKPGQSTLIPTGLSIHIGDPAWPR